LDRVPIDADQLDADTIKKIEDSVSELRSKIVDEYKPIRINGVPRHALLHPAHAEGRLQGQVFAPGDRVVYVQNSGKVEVASRGTVVGVNTTTLDVVFDEPIMSGSTLGGRCSENRGSIVPKSSVLNLTNRTVVAISQAAMLRKPNITKEDSSRTASPVGNATRSQFNRTNGQRGRGRGGGWYTPWEVNAPKPDAHVKPSIAPKQGSPFNPTVLLRKSQTGNAPATQSSFQTTAHQYLNGVAIPPPASLDQRQRVRTGPPKPRGTTILASSRDQSQHHSPNGGSANVPRGGRGGRGGPVRGGAAPAQSGRGGRGRGRGHGVKPA
jgi:5'-3' exoribonuclease 1